MYELTQIIKKRHGNKPLFLMGHSMGSFLTRTYITLHSDELKGVIISGTGQQPIIAVNLATIIGRIEERRLGKEKVSTILQKLTFGSFNKSFKPSRTKFDWLTTKEEEVDKFIKDDMNGQDFTVGAITDLFKGIKYLRNKKNMESISKDIPMLIFSGERDPVGDMGKGVKKVFNEYKEIGIKDVELILYSDGRHEMINEKDKYKVFSDVNKWIESV